MRYFKRHWDENRGDGHADWGTSIWYFEGQPDMWPSHQIEVYANGTVLKYDRAHIQDGFGGLSETALDAVEFAPFAISRDEFEQVWSSQEATNE
jgi:hypothetical protein